MKEKLVSVEYRCPTCGSRVTLPVGDSGQIAVSECAGSFKTPHKRAVRQIINRVTAPVHEILVLR